MEIYHQRIDCNLNHEIIKEMVGGERLRITIEGENKLAWDLAPRVLIRNGMISSGIM